MNHYDSHSHLPVKDFLSKEHIVSETPNDWDSIVSIHSPYKARSIGINPWCVTENDSEYLWKLEKILNEHTAINVGEIGLDYCKNRPDRTIQKHGFREQLELAKAFNRVATIHTVRAWEDTVNILEQIGTPKRGAIIHGFRGSAEIVSRLSHLNIFFSVGLREIIGVNSRQLQALRSIPSAKLLLESDGQTGKESLTLALSKILNLSEEVLVANNNALYDNIFSFPVD